MHKEYNLPADRFVKVCTVLVTLSLVLIVCIFIYLRIILKPFVLATSVIIFLIHAMTYLYSPKKIILNDDGVVVKRVLLGEVRIPYKSVKRVAIVKHPKMLRLFASGGLFGYFGLFNLMNDQKKSVYVYARRLRDMVMIEADKTYLIAPENPDEFVAELKAIIDNFYS